MVFSPVIEIFNSAAIVVTVLKRTRDDSSMTTITVNSPSSGRPQCFLFDLPFDALQNSFSAVESAAALHRYSNPFCLNDVTASVQK